MIARPDPGPESVDIMKAVSYIIFLGGSKACLQQMVFLERRGPYFQKLTKPFALTADLLVSA